MNDKSAGSALLRIIAKGMTLEFELEQGFADGYENRFEVPGETKQRASHPKGYDWHGGKFKPMRIEVNLVVGVQNAISTPKKLKEVVRTFFRMALPDNVETIRSPVIIQVGSWFSRVGYISDLGVRWDEPYDVDTGMPYRANVSLEFIADFYNIESNLLLDKNPKAGDFDFDFMGRAVQTSGAESSLWKDRK